MNSSSVKKYIAEFIGTFVLVLFACGTAVISGCTKNFDAAYAVTAAAFGLVIVAMAYSVGNISGCHINPAVSLAVFINNGMTIGEFVAYFIAQLMGISWGALAGAFLAPFMYGLYWKKVTKGAVWASFASGVLITVANMFFKFIESPINAGAIAMVTGLIVVPVVSLITPKMKKEEVDKIFACYDEEVKTSKKRSLE